METYEVPVWIKQYCLEDRNVPGRDWQNDPFLYHHGEDTWIIATDGFRLIGAKTPISVSGWSTETMYLSEIRLDSIKKHLKNYVERKPETLINIDQLRSRISESLNRSGCEQCSFTFEIICNNCQGETEAPCIRCAGQGSHPCVTCNKPDACDSCQGLGVVECSVCVAGKTSCPCTTAPLAEAIKLVSNTGKNIPPMKIDRLLSGIVHLRGNYQHSSDNTISIFRSDAFLLTIAGVANYEPHEAISISLEEIAANEATVSI